MRVHAERRDGRGQPAVAVHDLMPAWPATVLCWGRMRCTAHVLPMPGLGLRQAACPGADGLVLAAGHEQDNTPLTSWQGGVRA